MTSLTCSCPVVSSSDLSTEIDKARNVVLTGVARPPSSTILVILSSDWGVRGGVYTQSDNQNMKYQEDRRGEGGTVGGQFGKFHFRAVTGHFSSFSKINLIRK